MSNNILSKAIQIGVNALTQRSTGPVPGPLRPVQNVVNQVQQALDTFVAGVAQRAKDGTLFSRYPFGPMGEPLAKTLIGVNVGMDGQRTDPVGPNDSVTSGVEITQRFLARLGYLDMDHQVVGTFNGDTEEAVRQFQRDNGLEETGIVDDATARAMMEPRPRPGYGMPATDGHFDPKGEIALAQSIFQEAAEVYGEQLGMPTSAVMRQQDGSMVQMFENGCLVRTPDGGVRITDLEGNDLMPPPDYAAVQAEAGNHFINQLEGDSDRETDGNQNCGYASSNMSLSYLGVPGYSLVDLTPEQAFESTMGLRETGQPGSEDTDYSTTAGIYQALTTEEMVNAGVQVTVFENDINGERQSDADRMALAFMNGENDNIAFVVGGNPSMGWGTEEMNAHYPDEDGVYNGGHFVSVVGYNPETDCFLVMDPMASEPIEVSREQMAHYMEDTNVSHGEVLQITYNPPATEG
jgi:hypothetical protein